ncbi:MAG: hypothetical protein JSW15_07615, partial [Deltaproteobacteria bacterium]
KRQSILDWFIKGWQSGKPLFKGSKYLRKVLPRNEKKDFMTILSMFNWGSPSYHCVLIFRMNQKKTPETGTSSG